MTRASQPNRRTLAAAVVAAAAIVAGVTLLIVDTTDDPARTPAASSADKAQKRESERGFTDKVTVAQTAPGQARPATPRPEKLPPLIRTTTECKAALDPLRDLMDRYPTGLVVPPGDFSKVNAGLSAALNVCGPQVAMKFQQQEFLPWQTWEVPVGYKLPKELQPTSAPHGSKTITSKTPHPKNTGKPAGKAATSAPATATRTPSR